MNKWRRAALAIDVFRTNSWPDGEEDAVAADVAFLRERYEAMKWKLLFREAAYRAITELLERIAQEQTDGRT